MTYLQAPPIDSRSTYAHLTWERFKLIEQGFSDSPGVKLFYYQGELEILTVSPEHEIISRVIGMLIQTFLLEREVEFTPTGAMTQEKVGQASVQADESYCFGDLKPIPDLAIEVIFTSGSAQKLQRYQVLQVPEVWFWEDGVFSLYHLRTEGYEQISRSELSALSGLDITLLTRCMLKAQTSRLEAVKMLRQAIDQI